METSKKERISPDDIKTFGWSSRRRISLASPNSFYMGRFYLRLEADKGPLVYTPVIYSYNVNITMAETQLAS
jgi:hypothetical protein